MNISKIGAYLRDCVSRRKIPGAVCLIAKRGEVVFKRAYGWAQITPYRIRMNVDTVFDLASLTKPVCTATIALMLRDRKELALTDRVSKYLAEFAGRANAGITIKQLLAHTSGLPAWFPLYVIRPGHRLKFLAEIKTGRKTVLYSCLGYILLGKIIERITGQSLARLFEVFVAMRTASPEMRFGPVQPANVAATEYGNQYEADTAAEFGSRLPKRWRISAIRGTCHDGNAYYAFRGVAGNAGLFGTAQSVMKFMVALRNGCLVKPAAYGLMIKDHTGGSEKRGLGWIIDPYPGILSRRAYYHTGFTGTMACCDPAEDLIVVLLANAVHPRVVLNVMKPIRRRIVSLAAGP